MIKTQSSEKTHTPRTWPKPTPLLQAIEGPYPYPLNALPPIIRDAVSAYHQYGQQPLPLIACSALSNVSLACQTHANVARDKYLVSPVSLYFLVIASSGERKSAADNTFSHAIRQWELDTRKVLDPQITVAKTLHQTWRAERAGLLNQIKRYSYQGEENAALKQAFLELTAREPQVPLFPNLFFEDTTQEALAAQIATGWPSASLWTDEGGLIVGSQGMQGNATKFVALLNRLWDGKPFVAHRKTSESFTVENRRLSLSIMMQPLILEKLLSHSSGINRQSGFLARSLITYPHSTMGSRHYKEPPEKALTALPPFHTRLRACLDASLELDKTGCHQLPTLQFSPAAKTKWIAFFNALETGLTQTHRWESIKDFASKAAENVARLAALFQLFLGKQGEISHECMENAIEIIEWHLFETRRILGAGLLDRQQQDALKVLHWLHEKQLTSTSTRQLQQFGPVREKARLNDALNLLQAHHYVQEEQINGRTIFLLNPAVEN